TPIRTAMEQFVAGADYLDSGDWPDDWTSEQRFDAGEKAPGSKSVFQAGLYSFLLPGMGEYYVGHRRKAQVFWTAEALTWIGFIGFRTYGNWKNDDLIDFAAARAGADLEGKDDFFLDMVGFYDDIDQYNALGRATDPERPYYQDTPEYHWRWQSRDDREIYRHLKNRSREAYRRADFMIGLAIVNRVVSVIDAVRDARRTQRRMKSEFGDTGGRRLKIDVDPFDTHRQVRVTLFTNL
ncbi:MAG: hypothetical protein AB1744_07115, partial [Candidatus Zixiibacteriota bacterium]